MGSQTIYKVLLVIIFVVYVNTLKVSVIDDFTPDAPKLNTARPGAVASISTTGNQTLGNERDESISNYIGSDPSSSSISITGGEFSAAFGQGVSGYALVQYDGVDGSPNVNFTSLGPVDLTASATAYAFFLTVSSDIPSNFTIRVYSPSQAMSEVFFTYTPLIPDQYTDFLIPFTLFGSAVPFNSIAALELIVNASTPQDIAISQFGLFGYEASGYAYLDCNLNGRKDTNEQPLPGVTATLFDTSNVTVAVTTTDIQGVFDFRGLTNGTYRVCISNTGRATPTFPSNACLPVFLQNFNDSLSLFFGYTIATTIIPPENVTIECGTCNTTDCTGTPTGFGCSSSPSITASDVVTGNKCPSIITRTFSAAGATSVKQTITVVDTIAPVITKQASDQQVFCDNQVPSITTWIASHGGANATDCTATNWGANVTNPAVSACGAVTVTFTVSDACNNQTKTTASYITVDTKAPFISPKASNKQVPCDTVGNTDIAAFNSWITTRGGADATDNCVAKASLQWSNDNNNVPIAQGCNVTRPVVFSVSDGCGNSNSTAASFNIFDTAKPTITKQAVSRTVNCSVDINAAFFDFYNSSASATATDTCFPTLTWTPNNTVTPSGCSSVTPVLFTVTDQCGNFQTTVATFTVTASNGPVITKTPTPLSVNCSDPGSDDTIDNWLTNHGFATATDLCTGTDLIWSNNFNVANSGNGCKNISVIFTACNKCTPSKCTNTTGTLSLNDNFSPVFDILPDNITNECGTTTNADFSNWLQFYGNGQVSDDCTPPQNIRVTNNWPTGQLLPNGCNNQANVTFVATDACGNSSPGQLATYAIIDTFAPSISNAEDLSIECNSTLSGSNNQTFNNNAYRAWLSINGGASGSDACTATKWTNNGTLTVPSTCFFSEIVQFNATDGCGLVNTTYGVFTLADTRAPVITKQASDINTTCTSDFNNTLTNWLKTNGGAIATDTCTKVNWQHNFESLGGGCSKSALVTFTVSDDCLHADTTAATFAVVDNQAPVITTPAQPQSVACDFSAGEAFINFLNTNGGASAHDACQPDSELVWSYNLATAPTTCGSVTITFNVTDGCGAYNYTTAVFTVTDTNGPVFSPRASDLDVECDGNGNTLDYASWVASRGGARATDTCSLNITWTNNAPAKGPVGCGSQLVTYSATDGCGNKQSTTATYTVYDDIAPSIFPIAEDILVECDGKGNQANLTAWLNAHAGAKAVDICSGTALTWKYTLSGKFTSQCTNYTTYTFYVSDNCGNTAATTANFGITDSFPPTISILPTPLSLQCGSTNEEDIDEWLATHGGAEASDSCTITNWANDYVDEGFIGCYTRPVIFVAYDACLNVAFATTNLTIFDNINPQFINFPPDVTLPCDADISLKYTGYPGVQDSCSTNIIDFELGYTYKDTEVDVPSSPSTPQCPGDHIITRTFSATDLCGNTISQNQTITIKIQRSSGACQNNCTCDQECCPQPDPQNCLTSNCLPQTCAPSFCAAVLCSCPTTTTTRAIGSGDDIFDDMPNDPHPVPLDGSLPQCEPVYIFVNDDDHEPNGHDDHHHDHSVAIPQPSHFTNRVPSDKDKKEFRKTDRKSKVGRSVLQSIFSLFF